MDFVFGLIVDELIEQILRTFECHPLLIPWDHIGHELDDLLLRLRDEVPFIGIENKILEQLVRQLPLID